MTRALALTAVLLASACGTNYVPQSPGRVFVTMDGGTWSYVRDGHTYGHGFLGSGLREAVRGNPRAEAAAAEYHDRQRDGLLATLIGGVCAGGALGWAMADAVGNEGDSTKSVQTKLIVALACTGVMMGGTFYIASAEPYRWDAINIFNDSPPPPPPGMYAPPAYGPGYPPGASITKPAKKKQLGMRSE